jgi:hypothetical protein
MKSCIFDILDRCKKQSGAGLCFDIIFCQPLRKRIRPYSCGTIFIQMAVTTMVIKDMKEWEELKYKFRGTGHHEFLETYLSIIGILQSIYENYAGASTGKFESCGMNILCLFYISSHSLFIIYIYSNDCLQIGWFSSPKPAGLYLEKRETSISGQS